MQIDDVFTLKKMQGKGGWTFIEIQTEIDPERKKHGFVKVCGKIDDYELIDFNAFLMKNGNIFIPIKAEIRKKIGKGEGDMAHVKLDYAEKKEKLEIPSDIEECLSEVPHIYEKFLKLSDNEQNEYRDHIFHAKSDEVKSDRIMKLIEKLEKLQ